MHRSIFLKLLLIVVITGIMVNILVIFAMHSTSEPPPDGRIVIDRNVTFYLTSLAKEIGVPPDQTRALDVTQRTGLALRIEDEHHKEYFLSEANLHSPPNDRPERLSRHASKRDRVRPYFAVRVDHFRFIFYPPPPVRLGRGPMFLLMVLVFITTMLAVSYAAIRFLLSPIRSLAKGVEAVSAGHIDHRVPVRGQDELGKLGQAFNEMTERIKGMIATKERLLIDVSHELQSPLGRMKLALELIKDERGKQRLSRDIKEMERMVTEILESARLESSSGALIFQHTDLIELIHDHLQLYQDIASPVKFTCASAKVEAEIDAARIITVLRNLIENAFKYSANSSVEIALIDRPHEVMISVRDYGIGVPADEIQQLFEPFYRVDKSRSKKSGGYGLGLSLCERIVIAHKGKISVTSTPEIKGTLISFTLPKVAV